MTMPYQYHDGGRKAAGYKGKAGDCGARALAIVLDIPYVDACALVNEYAARERPRGKKKRSNAQTGVWPKTIQRIIEDRGGRWVPTMTIGSGCTVHLAAGELPAGRIIARVSRHYVAIIDGVLHDTYDASREGNRCVYGYYQCN